MPGPSSGWKLTYVPTPRTVVAVSPGSWVSATANQSLQPSPSRQ